MAQPKKITYADLKREFAKWNITDDTEITFGAGDLSLNRVQAYGHNSDKTVITANVEFNQVYKVVADGDTFE